MSPFVDTPHMFQNMGDGTYNHSGLLAIRAAVGAGVNMTYKLLFNDAVALTGGQSHDGGLTPWAMTQQLKGEGVTKIIVVADDPDKYAPATPWAAGVTIRHRDEMEAVQAELREIEGVTVLLYDQVCAAEKRRRRKRGKMEDPAKRLFINSAVCEAVAIAALSRTASPSSRLKPPSGASAKSTRASATRTTPASRVSARPLSRSRARRRTRQRSSPRSPARAPRCQALSCPRPSLWRGISSTTCWLRASAARV